MIEVFCSADVQDCENMLSSKNMMRNCPFLLSILTLKFSGKGSSVTIFFLFPAVKKRQLNKFILKVPKIIKSRHI